MILWGIRHHVAPHVDSVCERDGVVTDGGAFHLGDLNEFICGGEFCSGFLVFEGLAVFRKETLQLVDGASRVG